MKFFAPALIALTASLVTAQYEIEMIESHMDYHAKSHVIPGMCNNKALNPKMLIAKVSTSGQEGESFC